jgi:hypothetical protein
VDVDWDCDTDLVEVDIGLHAMRIWANSTPQFNCISADPNRDGAVDVLDLLVVMSAWGTNDSRADTTRDGVVDVDDLLYVVGHLTPSAGNHRPPSFGAKSP